LGTASRTPIRQIAMTAMILERLKYTILPNPAPG
jgi:hypothetical protein